MRLAGKNIVVAGGTRGIGRAAALRLAAEGAQVVVGSDEEPPFGAEALQEAGILHVQANLATVDGPAQLIRQARQLLGPRLHHLVYFAGVYLEHKPAGRSPNELWEITYHVKVRGSYLSALEFIAGPHDDGDDTSIVFVSSINARQSEPTHLAYDGACAAVEGQTRAFAVEYARQGIRVNCLAPGLIETRLTREVVDDPREHQHARRCIPLGRIGQPDDCSGAVVFLCSADAAYVTGQVLTVDGGIEALQAPPSE